MGEVVGVSLVQGVTEGDGVPERVRAGVLETGALREPVLEKVGVEQEEGVCGGVAETVEAIQGVAV